jgi:hypothetical protein
MWRSQYTAVWRRRSGNDVAVPHTVRCLIEPALFCPPSLCQIAEVNRAKRSTIIIPQGYVRLPFPVFRVGG